MNLNLIWGVNEIGLLQLIKPPFGKSQILMNYLCEKSFNKYVNQGPYTFLDTSCVLLRKFYNFFPDIFLIQLVSDIAF